MGKLCKSRMHSGSVLVTQSGPCRDVTRSGELMECRDLEKLTLKNVAAVFPYVDVLQHPMATWKADADLESEWSSVVFGWGGSAQATQAVDMTSESPMATVASAAYKWLEQEIGKDVLTYYS